MAKKRNRRNRRRDRIEGFRPIANPELAHWDRERGKSSAASPHIAAPRKGTRRERERQAIRDQQRGHES